MVKRILWKRYAYVAFALLVMLASWESGKASPLLVSAAAAGAEEGRSIPQESIRLRILANSDAPLDQWIKREVRDEVVDVMNSWVSEPQGIEAAREVVKGHLPELEELVGEVLAKNGFDYSYSVELGKVPFPAKMYGNELYPAGDYEALRISIGAAEGQNWWCVLFPPLCFVDSEMVVKKNTAHAAELGAETEQAPEAGKKGASKAKTESKSKTEAAGAKGEEGKKDGELKKSSTAALVEEADTVDGTGEPEIRFFLWDLLKKVGSWFA